MQIALLSRLGEQMLDNHSELTHFREVVESLSKTAANLRLDLVKHLLEMTSLQILFDQYEYYDEEIFFVD